MYRQSNKNLLNSNISATRPHNMANFGPLAAEIGSLVWVPSKFQRVSRLGFGGILPGAKFTFRPSLAFSYIGSVTARHSSSGRQPNCSVEQRACHRFMLVCVINFRIIINRYCSDVAQQKPTKLCTMFGRLLGWCTMYTFSGALVL